MLRWRCRRGMRELDVLLERYLRERYPSAPAAEQQAYLATGPGRIQSPQGTTHVIRQVGTTVVMYSWQPGDSKDPGAADIQAALETLGSGFPVQG